MVQDMDNGSWSYNLLSCLRHYHLNRTKRMSHPDPLYDPENLTEKEELATESVNLPDVDLFGNSKVEPTTADKMDDDSDGGFEEILADKEKNNDYY